MQEALQTAISFINTNASNPMKMRRLSFIAVMLLLATLVSAGKFDVSVSPDARNVKLGDAAEFELEISQSTITEEVFEVFSTDVLWDVRTEGPLLVKASVPFKTKLYVRPLNVNPGMYSVMLNFRPVGTNELLKKIVQIEVTSPFPPEAEYLPAVRGDVNVAPDVDPRQGITVKLSLENQNKRVLKRIDAKLRSNVINKDYTTSLGPLEKKTLTFVADVDPRTPPQQDVLYITVLVPEAEKAYQFDLLPISYNVIPYGGIIPRVSAQSAFLKRSETVRLTNEGNKRLTHVYRVPAFFVKRWFISSIPEGVVEAGELAWEVTLEPGESKDLNIIYNYRPLFWLFLIAVIATVSYYVFRSPLIVRKRATVVSTEEGGISELKVVIEIINRSRKNVRHARIMDLVPRLADVIKEFKATILEPTKVIPHEQRGTLIRWDIDLVEAGEHRILTYKARAKMTILGGLSLPVTAVKFIVDGKERETVSNQPEIKFRT